MGGGGNQGDRDLAASLGVRTGQAWALQARIRAFPLQACSSPTETSGLGPSWALPCSTSCVSLAFADYSRGRSVVSLPSGSDVRDRSGETRDPALARALTPETLSEPVPSCPELDSGSVWGPGPPGREHGTGLSVIPTRIFLVLRPREAGGVVPLDLTSEH